MQKRHWMTHMQWLIFALWVGVTLGCSRPVEEEPMQTERVVVLGSSTAAGAGASQPGFAWVNRYAAYLQLQRPGHTEVINLAVPGYTTYHVLPVAIARSADRPAADTAHNLTKALAYKPTAIIVNLPSNDAARGYSVTEITDNFKALAAAAGSVPLWIATPQPKNFEPEKRLQQLHIKRFLETMYPGRTIDFWTVLASPDGTIIPAYDTDGTHVNDDGHEQLFLQVVKAGVVKMQ
jgi:lysophospholipase L1-like esterase